MISEVACSSSQPVKQGRSLTINAPLPGLRRNSGSQARSKQRRPGVPRDQTVACSLGSL